jgi:hypothetical protein
MTQRQVQILIGLAVVVAVLLVALIAVMVIGWGDQEAAPTTLPTTTSASTSTTSVATTTSTSTTTSSTSTSTTSTSTTTTTTLPAGACPGTGAGPLPGAATVAVEVMGDFDGDGAGDRFLVYEDGGGHYRARVELSYGYSSVAPDLVPGPGVINAKSVNLGGDRDLAIAESIASPSSRLASFWALRDCDLEAVRLDGDTLAQFPLRGSGMALAGVTCNPDGINVTSAEDRGGGDWAAASVVYFWDPDALAFSGGMGAAAILHSPEDDDIIMGHADWNC